MIDTAVGNHNTRLPATRLTERNTSQRLACRRGREIDNKVTWKNVV